MKNLNSDSLNTVNNMRIELANGNNFILITHNISSCNQIALNVTCKLLSLLNKEILLLLDYTQWHVLFEMHPNYAMNELGIAMRKILDMAKECDIEFTTEINEKINHNEVHCSIFFYQS